MDTRWTLEDAIREGFLLAYLAQEAERGITAQDAADVEKAIAALKTEGALARSWSHRVQNTSIPS